MQIKGFSMFTIVYFYGFPDTSSIYLVIKNFAAVTVYTNIYNYKRKMLCTAAIGGLFVRFFDMIWFVILMTPYLI